MLKHSDSVTAAVLLAFTFAPARALAAQQPEPVGLTVQPPAIGRERLAALLATTPDTSDALAMAPRRFLAQPDDRPQVELLFAVSPDRAALLAEGARTGGVSGCLRGAPGGRSDAPTAPWSRYDSLTEGLGYVLLQVTPMPKKGTPCAPAGRVPSTPPLTVAPFGDVDSVAVSVSGRPMRAALEGQAMVGGERNGWHQTREYLPLGVLEPSAGGERPRVWLTLYSSWHAPGRVEVPPPFVRDAWRARVPARIARLRAGQSVLRPALPLPRDPLLRDAYSNAAATDPSAAARAIVDRALREPLVPDDQRFAALYVGSVLAQLGDSVGGRAQFRDALADAPCLTLPAASSSSDRALLDALRPPERCSVVSPAQMLLAGALLPGGGARAAGHTRLALVEGAVTAALFGGAIALDAEARGTHGDYLATTSSVEAPRLLARANSLRRSASASAIAAGTSWVAFAASSWLRERLHAARTRPGRQYGALVESRPGTPTLEGAP